jgi:hypothetical protein
VANVPGIVERISGFHVLDYQDLAAASDRLLTDVSENFIFIHLPIPHPGGIYNRRTGEFATKDSSYLDNLALSDKYLAHVRSLLQQNGQWDSSAIVIMGDHSWRTKLFWSSAPDWTHEEQAASDGGQFDDRPGYIVKLPNQHVGAKIDTPFAATNTRILMDKIMDGEIESPDELESWVASAGSK